MLPATAKPAASAAPTGANGAPQLPASVLNPTGTTAPSPTSATAQALAGITTAKGIDVSSWQGKIDWSKVKSDGVQVAYMKATEGKDFTDKTYADNRKGAQANGIAAGAYDFANPGSVSSDPTKDAQAEANYFLKSANVKKGDLTPMLDLESAGTMSPTQLAQWVKVWGQTVKAATGSTPLLYTSPSFWNSKVGGSSDAASGFKLWIANWGVSSPTIPQGWDGSYSSWQYSDNGSTSGINGRVDQDHVKDPSSLVVS